jgi:hypothetical protein
MGVAGEALSRVISPNVTRTAEALRAQGVPEEEIKRIGSVQLLDKEGVDMTAAQVLGGQAKRAEDYLEKTPIFGMWVREARGRSTEGMNKAAANRALEPIGESIPKEIPAGHSTTEYVANKLGEAYDEVHPKMQLGMDNELRADFKAVNDSIGMLPPERVNQVQKLIEDTVHRVEWGPGSGLIPGDEVQKMLSQLRHLERKYTSSPDADQSIVGGAVGSIVDSISAALQRQNAPELAKRLSDIDRGWANFVPTRRASQQAPASQAGVFSGSQLGRASKAGDYSHGKWQSSEGKSLQQDLAEAASMVLPSQVASSGTAERGLAHAALAGHLIFSPSTAAASLAVPMVYSQTGQRLLKNAILNRPSGASRVADIVRQYAPYSGLAPIAVNNQGQTQ